MVRACVWDSDGVSLGGAPRVDVRSSGFAPRVRSGRTPSVDKGVVGMEGVCGGVDPGSVRTAGVWVARAPH